MFSRKKKNNMKFIIIALVCLIVAIICTTYLISSIANQNDVTELTNATSENITYDESYYEEDDEYNDNEIDSIEDEEEPTETITEDPYFIVREEEGKIKVYFYKNEKEKFLQDTDIVFDTLSDEDQKKFIEGIKITNEKKLNNLIMDYES